MTADDYRRTDIQLADGRTHRFPEPGEILVEIRPGARVDDHGRIRITAWWRTDLEHIPNGVQAQCHDTHLGAYIDRHCAAGHTVTIINPDHPALANQPAPTRIEDTR